MKAFIFTLIGRVALSRGVDVRRVETDATGRAVLEARDERWTI